MLLLIAPTCQFMLTDLCFSFPCLLSINWNTSRLLPVSVALGELFLMRGLKEVNIQHQPWLEPYCINFFRFHQFKSFFPSFLNCRCLFMCVYIFIVYWVKLMFIFRQHLLKKFQQKNFWRSMREWCSKRILRACMHVEVRFTKIFLVFIISILTVNVIRFIITLYLWNCTVILVK